MTSYLILQSWLDGPKWLRWLLYQSYCNPIFMICIVSFITHFSFQWLISLVIAFSLTLVVLTWADAQCSVDQLSEAYKDMVSGKNYEFHPVSNEITKSIIELSSLKIYQETPLIRKVVEKNSWYKDLFNEPVRVFIAKDKTGKILQEPKAYTNFLGSSLVFLPRPYDQLDVVDRFFLLHELEHVNFDGARQLSRTYSRPLLLAFNIIMLISLTTTWWEWLIIIFYVVMNLFAQSLALTKRELIADNGALLKIPDAHEQKEVVDFLIELSSSYLQNEKIANQWMNQSLDFTIKERKDLIKKTIRIYRTKAFIQKKDRLHKATIIWLDRLLHFRWYEYRLKRCRSIPVLGWTPFHDTIATVPFILFLIYLGIHTEIPPVFPFALMTAYILFDKLWLQFKYMNRLEEISNRIADHIV